MQVTVVGAQLGEWGRKKYGLANPQKVDALQVRHSCAQQADATLCL